jgi:tRNA (guanine37-N1)-methyltransferase
MRFDVVTLFPEMLELLTQHGITRRAHEQGAWKLACWDPRRFTSDAHRTVDDRPFGGGPGMILMAEPLAQCVEAARAAQRQAGCARTRVIALSASGEPLRDARVRALAAEGTGGPEPAGQGGGNGGTGLVLVCGRYEGIDQRFLDLFVDEEVSVGDFVLSGGEIAAMALVDAVVRHLPGTMKPASAQEESFVDGRLDVPHYTRPESWRGHAVPEVLMSGHHARIAQWREEQSMTRTRQRRPDLLGEGRNSDQPHPLGGRQASRTGARGQPATAPDGQQCRPTMVSGERT